MRRASRIFIQKLADYTHAFTCGEVHIRLALDPVRMLEPELEAIEAVYPQVQACYCGPLAPCGLLATSICGDVQRVHVLGRTSCASAAPRRWCRSGISSA